MNRTDLKQCAGISFNVSAKMGRNDYASMERITKICDAWSYNISDVVEFVETI